jgi:putative chitinase
VNRVAGCLAQCGHEAVDFTVSQENPNYSAERLHAVFPRYCPTLESAQPYKRRSEKIANRVYGGRLGNGPEASGDDYKFRGRGAIQLTSRSNYQEVN